MAIRTFARHLAPGPALRRSCALEVPAAKITFTCTGSECGFVLDEATLHAQLDLDGWFFQCPACEERSELIEVTVDGGPESFIQPIALPLHSSAFWQN
jgi:hypothetical protein